MTGRRNGGAEPTDAMKPTVTSWEVGAMTLLSLLAFAAGVWIAAANVNLSLSAKNVGGSIMARGMVMRPDQPGASMKDMSAVAASAVTYTAPVDARGDRELKPRMENGVKVFPLETSVIRWHILPNVSVEAYAYNQQVPGPRIHVMQGDRVRFVVTNHLPEPTTIHWHGLIVPNNMDGPADITQRPIAPGETFTYEFTVRQSGTYFYHSHDEPDRQQGLGLYGAFIVDSKGSARHLPPHDLEYTVQLQEWLVEEGRTYPAMIMDGPYQIILRLTERLTRQPRRST